MSTRSSAEAASEVLRELQVRRRCYTRWVDDGKLTAVEARDRLERLERALEIVERAVVLESVPLVRERESPELVTGQQPDTVL